ncbi:unnamed protein product [Linum tenue]|uniref:Pectinesterase inhibitor domain-containing protein n=1 Tax=Linum tenue TaxID=586396 RepID=A0AAV0KN64_9ROSI|nr:unnamed protein product [Linum tenue]
MKSSLDTCIQNYDKAIASLDTAKEACKACDKDKDTNKDKKCSPKHVSKVNFMLSAAVSNFSACEEALNDAGSPPKPWVKDDAMVEGTNILLEVAKKIK